MRLARLDLVRYGKFTGHTLDFGAPEAGRPDLHLVYGPNEAGKSTAFAAFLDLLFGIRAVKAPNYAFLHPYPTMRIGARLDLSGGPRDLVRIRRQQATLLDADERPLDEGLITAELGGLGRDTYRSMFSLDDASLEEGGEEILASRGDLGRILFSGSAGAAGLSRTLDALREEADGFFRSGAHRTRLNELKTELDAIKAERERLDTQAAAYKRLVDDRDRVAAAYDVALKARSEAGARRDVIGRLLAALPLRARLEALRAALAPMAGLPEPPAGWAENLPEIERAEVRLAEERRGILRDAEDLQRERDTIEVDDVALRMAADHDGLADLRAAAVTAARDLPRRHPQLALADQAVGTAMLRLGRPSGSDPLALMLPAATVGELRELIASRSGIESRRDAAQREAEEAARELSAARDALNAAGGHDGAVPSAARARLAALLETLRDTDSAGRLKAAVQARTEAAADLGEALRALAPWTGTADALATLVLPAMRDAEGWAAALAEAESETRRRDDEAATLTGERDDLRAQVDALGEIAGVVDETQAGALRTARERAWAEHRARLDAASADRFEDALRRDDVAVAARFGQANDVARLKEASIQLASLETRLNTARARAATLQQRRDGLRGAVAAALASFDPPLPATMSAAQLVGWLARVPAGLRAREALRDAEAGQGAAAVDLAASRDRLAAALDEADVVHDAAADLGRLAAVGRAAVDRGTALAGLELAVENARRRSESRAPTLAAAEAGAVDWRVRWEAACGSCWLGADDQVPSTAAVAETLEVLGGLAPELRTRDDLRHRIAAMQADQAGFAARLEPLAQALGLDAPADPERALALDDVIGRRIADARAARAALEACLARQETVARRRAHVDQDLAANAARGDTMRQFFGVETLVEVGPALRRCGERDRLRRERDTLERDLCGRLQVADVAAAEALLAGLEDAALEAEHDAVAGRYDAADVELRQHHARRVTAEASLDAVGGDDVVARLETKRQAVMLDIEDQARRFIRLKGGIAAAEQALSAYRDRHRSAMMERASQAFATISRGAYVGLAAQPGDKSEFLVVRSATGATKQAGDLSKGTRFQLYLALRAAGYHEYVETRRVVPFVADDIMETFDDFRAEEAFRIFAGMAEVGQVVYLTHHRHLVDIARSVCPSVTVHRLDAV